MRETTNAYKILVETLKGRVYLRDLATDRSIILKCILKVHDKRLWTNLKLMQVESIGWLLFKRQCFIKARNFLPDERLSVSQG
jgi:hypothetical protein